MFSVSLSLSCTRSRSVFCILYITYIKWKRIVHSILRCEWDGRKPNWIKRQMRKKLTQKQTKKQKERKKMKTPPEQQQNKSFWTNKWTNAVCATLVSISEICNSRAKSRKEKKTHTHRQPTKSFSFLHLAWELLLLFSSENRIFPTKTLNVRVFLYKHCYEIYDVVR